MRQSGDVAVHAAPAADGSMDAALFEQPKQKIANDVKSEDVNNFRTTKKNDAFEF